jgi:hypothetical protein
MMNWGDVPTWVTAGVAFLALIGATLAYRAQSEQLRLQRIQLADQTRIQEREQANKVGIGAYPIDGELAKVLPEDKGAPVHMVVVINGSERPIRKVASKIEAMELAGRATGQHDDKLADVYGSLEPYDLRPGARRETFVFGARDHTMPVLRANRKAAFVWSFTVAEYPELSALVRFDDDAGLHWEVSYPDLHLQKLHKRDW